MALENQFFIENKSDDDDDDDDNNNNSHNNNDNNYYIFNITISGYLYSNFLFVCIETS